MSPLEVLIRERIAKTGLIPVAGFMELALGHPEYGYYMTEDPFGTKGDFITAPEISQVFGELIGLWAAVTWQQLGSPDRLIVIECGPGRGTLMNDLLRAAKSVPDFHKAIEIHLVETSPAMRRRQKATLSDDAPTWHDTITTVPAGPTILVANEFLDALPIHQFVMTDAGWAERCVDVGPDGFSFVAGALAPDGLPVMSSTALPGTIFETCPAAMAFAGALTKRFGAAPGEAPGAALIIDYGHEKSATGETLQAVHNHKFTDPLADPGKADMTAHVDFDAFGRQLISGGALAIGPITQSTFLSAIGIRERTQQLAHNASPDARADMESATARLIEPAQMGELFKVMVATSAEMPRLAGFESWVEEPC
jgi:NADH dehydrogenase [ubiquinone] 1 alpha subcomplex assembly factor 7